MTGTSAPPVLGIVKTHTCPLCAPMGCSPIPDFLVRNTPHEQTTAPARRFGLFCRQAITKTSRKIDNPGPRPVDGVGGLSIACAHGVRQSSHFESHSPGGIPHGEHHSRTGVPSGELDSVLSRLGESAEGLIRPPANEAGGSNPATPIAGQRTAGEVGGQFRPSLAEAIAVVLQILFEPRQAQQGSADGNRSGSD